MHPTLPLRHFLLALAVVAVWGTNFVVIKLALAITSPGVDSAAVAQAQRGKVVQAAA